MTRPPHPLLAAVGPAGVPDDAAQRALSRRARAGDPAARAELAARNVPLVVSVAAGLAGRWRVDPDDAIGAGCLGLLRAIELYDPDRPEKLGTYATYWIRCYVWRLARDDRVVAVPSYLGEAIRRADRGLPPVVPGRRGCRPDRLAAGRAALAPIPQESAAGTPGVCLDHLPAPAARGGADPEAAEWAAELARRVDDLAALDPRLPRMVRLRYGLDGGGPRTLAAVGAEYGISRERARQCLGCALRVLGRTMARTTQDEKDRP